MQTIIVEVKFNAKGKRYEFFPNGFSVGIGDEVVVDTPRGLDLGVVVSPVKEVERDEYSEPLKDIVRIATENDKRLSKANEDRGRKILKETKEIVKGYGLEMKIVNVEMSLDGAKIVINFTAENRVDFRELVKELGSKFKARIELRQIGARDEVKEVGGLGPCGKVCCCKDFLKDFEHVSIKMPKVQGLSLNPVKISGLCGRLMCCLAYENGHYSETFRQMPRINSEVETPSGKGVVVYNNLLKRTVQVRIGQKGEADCQLLEFPLESITVKSRNSTGIDDEVGGNLGNLE